MTKKEMGRTSILLLAAASSIFLAAALSIVLAAVRSSLLAGAPSILLAAAPSIPAQSNSAQNPAFTLPRLIERTQSNSVQNPVESKSAQNPAQSAQEAERSCRAFVQGFYRWYVPKHSLEDVLKYRRSVLSPELYSALKQDLAASAKNPDEVEGLDFDPFLNAQDVAERYVFGKVTAKGASFRMAVYGIWSGKKSEKPDVVAEVACKEGKCLFVNFHYGKTESAERENLLSVLKDLKKGREKH